MEYKMVKIFKFIIMVLKIEIKSYDAKELWT